VIEDVALEIPDNLSVWPPGRQSNAPVMGVSRTDPKHYKVFRSRDALTAAGFAYGGHPPHVHRTWSDHVRVEAV
jgi:hypothetical protein